MICPLCLRDVDRVSDHHLIPKCRGGSETLPICQDCHRSIHSFFSNKELEDIYFSVEALMSHPKFNKHIKWISKQDPHKEIKTKLPKEQKRRGRNG